MAHHQDRALLGIWQQILKEYTGRDLTQDLNRLIELAGVAESLHLKGKATLGKYCAGLWETGFERQLCWSSQQHNLGPSNPDLKPSVNDRIAILYPTNYVAPSWSWASPQHDAQLVSIRRRAMVHLPRKNYKSISNVPVMLLGGSARAISWPQQTCAEHVWDPEANHPDSWSIFRVATVN